MLKKLNLKNYYDKHAYLILNALRELYNNKNIKFSEVQYYQLDDEEYLYYNNMMHEIDWIDGVYYVFDDIDLNNKIWNYYDDETGTWKI